MNCDKVTTTKAKPDDREMPPGEAEWPEQPGSLDRLGPQDLSRLMPMFLLVDHDGVIRSAGPTIIQVCGPTPLIGRRFSEVFRSMRGGPLPHGALDPRSGGTLHLSLKDQPETSLRALLIPAAWVPEAGVIRLALPLDDAEDTPQFSAACERASGTLVNCSFGIDLADATRRHALTGADFAHTDLAMELLYLQEAKTAIMRELQALNGRLDEARRAAEDQALTDPLTGLSNRRALEASLADLIDKLENDGDGFAVVHADLDHFKQVNDGLGHAAGDLVLCQAARILREEIRRDDIAARVGGDEFVLLLPGFQDAEGLAALGHRLIGQIEKPIAIGDDYACVSASIGIAIVDPGIQVNGDHVLSAADGALYRSKRAGRARCSVCRVSAAEGG